MRDDFCAFILTHGRPDKVLTYRTLRRAGYTGKILSLLMMKIRHGISTWLNLVNRCWCFPKPISPVVLTKPIISVTAAQFLRP